ncbi:MAG TPA: GtrA family protein [Candidatus Omnitrophota bacterium]|nr:GtrA family protein [Candidatus Omnitrophota bacterium]
MMLALRYVLFAALATAVNLATQHAALMVWDVLPAAMAAGTATGLVAKYLLDKRWIFFDPSPRSGRQFGLYTLMGVLTTAIFWGAELAFAAWFETALMRDLGAVLGLAIGYVTKYQLDRRFVFVVREPA